MASEKRRHRVDGLMRGTFFWTAIFSVLILAGIFMMLVWNGVSTFSEVSLGEFFGSGNWNPSAYGEPEFGILAMIKSTLLITLGSMIIAVPIGIGTAAFLSEFAPHWLREIVKPMIEMLAAIPSVAVGFIGIVLVSPMISGTFDLEHGLNAMNGSILLAIMALPTIISVSDEAIRAVPDEYREASYALGGNSWNTLIRVILPACYSGLIAAVMLGLGRAIGETMTVLMATGNATAMPDGFFDPVRTMTATIAIELGEVPFGTPHYHSLFAIGLVLFIITLIVNMTAENIANRYRKQGR